MKVLYFKEHVLHDLKTHPENAQRIEAIKEYLKGSLDFLEVNPEFDLEHIKKVHSEKYIEKIKRISEKTEKYNFLDPDTYVTRGTFKASVLAANLGILGYEKYKNFFALTRPPGHHAKRDSQGGFCIFNNIAILEKRIREDGKRVLILDLDYHHGNGTQELIDRDTRFISIHRFGVYPGTGLYYERDGKDVYNIPIDFESVNDMEYLYIFEKIVYPLVIDYNPDVVLVSMGFDGYKYDIMGDWELEKVWQEIFRNLRDYRVVLLLEGGYHPLGIQDGIEQIDKGLRGKDVKIKGRIRKSFRKYIDSLSKYFGIEPAQH